MIPVQDIKTKYGNEIALVLLCCRVYFQSEERSLLQEFIAKNDIDWEHVLYLLRYHRVEPIVYKILGNSGVPNEVAEQIRQKQLFLIQQNFKQALETERIIALLTQNDIRCIPYKGVAFSKQLYGDIVSRESSDIDLIVSPDDFERVMILMENDGYVFENRLEYRYFGKDVFKRKKGLNFNKYKGDHREFHIEFHWKILENSAAVDQASNNLLFEGTNKMFLAKSEVAALNMNAHYLAVFIHHSTSDGFSVLRNILDICQIEANKHHSLEITHITKSITAYRLENAACVCNFLSEYLLGVSLPFQLGNSTIPNPVQKHFKYQLLGRDKIGDHFKIRFLNKSVWHLKDNTAEKLKYLFACIQIRFIPSPKDIRIFKLPRSLSFFYAVLKPFRSIISRVSDEEEKRITRQQQN